MASPPAMEYSTMASLPAMASHATASPPTMAFSALASTPALASPALAFLPAMASPALVSPPYMASPAVASPPAMASLLALASLPAMVFHVLASPPSSPTRGFTEEDIIGQLAKREQYKPLLMELSTPIPVTHSSPSLPLSPSSVTDSWRWRLGLSQCPEFTIESCFCQFNWYPALT